MKHEGYGETMTEAINGTSINQQTLTTSLGGAQKLEKVGENEATKKAATGANYTIGDDADVSDAAKLALAREKQARGLLEILKQQEAEQAENPRVAELKSLLATPEGISQYLSNLSGDQLAQAMLANDIAGPGLV